MLNMKSSSRFQRITGFFFLSIILFSSCMTDKKKVELLIYNATIYTVDSLFSIADAMAIQDNKVIYVGTRQEAENKFEATNKMDAQGKFIYPGFIDAHTHFLHYGLGLQRIDLTGTASWAECLERIKKYVAENKVQAGEWIVGRGWDQNDWSEKTFPDKEELDQLYQKNPVLLKRVDGHAVLVNQIALELAGIRTGSRVWGGEIELKANKLTGILIDNAIELVTIKIPPPSKEQMRKALLDAQRNCFEVGLTTVDDCGLNVDEVELIDSLHKSAELKMRVYAMLSDAKGNLDFLFKNGKIKTDRLNVRSVKVYADGALGSRGACLLQPYTDKPGWTGFLLATPQHFDSIATALYEKGFQMCTHAIGDSGNRIVLETYARQLKRKNDLRWRIEHAQVVNSIDFKLFGDYSIIPSVQPTHATSDMPWAEERLGPERVKGAYAYKELLKQNNWIPLGTDFPVEDISPFKTFYAATIRKDSKGWPDKGFQMENALSREDALRGMTVWAAKSNFEEHEKGSLEPGKFADFIILDRDLLKCTPAEILQAKVISTFINGEQVHCTE